MSEQLLLQEPHHELQALGNLGNVHKQCSEFAEAVKCYDAVLQLNPHDWRSLLSKAVALMGLKQQHAAQTALQQAYQHSGMHFGTILAYASLTCCMLVARI